MKYALLVGRTLNNGTTSGIKNIGDYIQSIAAAQYLPQIDEYYDRDSFNSGEQIVKMIMNAWYMWKLELFPISKRIIPLPVSMHISPMIADRLFKMQDVMQWFKDHEPIGCRDKGTELLMKSNGIDAYFSGCLTLTLGKKYKSQAERRGLVFVDPYLSRIFKELNILDCFVLLFSGIANFKNWMKISRKIKHTYCISGADFFRRAFYAATVIRTYGQIFSAEELSEAEYITHHVKVGEGTELCSEEEKLTYAESLVKKYAVSKMVVTSRIHCALPCLAVGTSVLFTVGSMIDENSPASSAGRFGGLIELFHTARIKKTKIVDCPKMPISNKDDYRKLAADLQKQCESFIGMEPA